jgi:hypothetical protein
LLYIIRPKCRVLPHCLYLLNRCYAPYRSTSMLDRLYIYYIYVILEVTV